MNYMLTRFIGLFVAAILVALGLSIVVSASPANADESPAIATYPLPIKRLDPSVDQVCPKNSVKLFYLKLKIRKGYDGSFYADGSNVSEIHFFRDRGAEIVDIGNAVDERTIEFMVVPALKPRTTKPDRTKPMYVVAVVEAGLEPEGLKVGRFSADCLEAGQ